MGNHWVLNNQYDGAVVAAGHGEYRDLGPINSLHLRPHYNQPRYSTSAVQLTR